MRKHFRARHPEDIIIIQEEGLLPQCNNCGIFQKNALTERHTSSLECQHHSKTKITRKKEIIQQAAPNVKFTVEEVPTSRTSSFKYLGQIITAKDDDLPAVVAQINKARQIWARISRILKKKTNSNIKVMSTFYKVIVQRVLLYGSETWVLSKFMMAKLQSFHHMCARFITGQHIKLIGEEWVYPRTEDILKQATLLTMEEYICKRRNTVKNYILSTNIFRQCQNSKGTSTSWKKLTWWENVTENDNDEDSVETEISDSESGTPSTVHTLVPVEDMRIAGIPVAQVQIPGLPVPQVLTVA
jgi:hypothetical protein